MTVPGSTPPLPPREGGTYVNPQGRVLGVAEVLDGDPSGREVRGHLDDGTPYACDRLVFERAWSLVPDTDDCAELLLTAVRSAGSVLSGSGVAGLIERDLEAALLELVPPSQATISSQYAVRLSNWSGRLGPVDVALEGRSGDAMALAELKWGGPHLWNCAWDMVKMASCVGEEVAPTAMLVAGATRADWDARTRGTELFDPRVWELDAFLARFSDLFGFWREDVQNHPMQLPDRWVTTEAESSEVVVDGEVWEIRVVLVEEVDGPMRTIDYVPAARPSPAKVAAMDADPGDGPAPIAESAEPLTWLRDAGFVSPPGYAGEGGSVTAVHLSGLFTDEGVVDDMDSSGSDASSVRWFASPSRRRAYAEARGWRRVGSPQPEVLHVSAGSGLGAHFELVWNGRELQLERKSFRDDIETTFYQPTDDVWRRLWGECDRLDVWGWRDSYQPDEMVMDGYGWAVSIAVGGRTCDSSGYMAFPGDPAPSGGSPTWQRFLLAMEDLLGAGRLH